MDSINECLNCKNKPCTKGCPLGNNIPEIINLIKNNNCMQAYEELSKTTVLPAICGRICPHMSQCMGKCVKGIKGQPVLIGNIEAFLGDMAIKEKWDYNVDCNKGIDKKVAIIGGGPAGLTCAAFLARKGFNVTIYEKNSELGGLLRYGIPKFRLDREVLNLSIDKILKLGINVKYGYELEKNLDLKNLEKEFDAIFISIGANIPWKMGIIGEDLNGVLGGNTLLEKIEKNESIPDFCGKNIAIIGGGNVAIDCARTVKKLGGKSVKIIYRRAKEQMPAENEEIEIAESEGIEILYQNNIVKILGDKKVEQVECIRTKLVQKEGENRPVPVNIENSNYLINMDYVIMAIGSQTESEVLNKLDLELDKYNYIKINDEFRTSNSKIWAGGDVIGSRATVAWASFFGRKTAESIEKTLKMC